MSLSAVAEAGAPSPTTYSCVVLSRKKQSPDAPVTPEPLEPEVDRVAGKGRPTPKRKDQVAAQRRPLVDDGRAATREQKQARRLARTQAREGMMRGEERYLSGRDKGPERRFMRDCVDSRRNVGEILLPAMLFIIVLSLIPTGWAYVAFFGLAYALIVGGIVDSVLLWRRVKRRVIENFGAEPSKGSKSYVIMRAFQMRMSRVPRPQVNRGDEVVARRR